MSLVTAVVPVFRDSARALTLMRALVRQEMPAGMELEILIVDDGSGEEFLQELRRGCAGHATLEALPSNQGRSVARNAGAASARGELLFFIDCDCMPASVRLLAMHVESIRAGSVASGGPVLGDGGGFWDRYQALASRRRALLEIDGNNFGGTTQNLLVRRDAFRHIGGFDESYRTYGFEDRDLLLRLAGMGPTVWTSGAEVRHLDKLSLASVCAKMALAGRDAAITFSETHPEPYRRLGYAAFDARQRPRLRSVARVLAPLLPVAIRMVAALLERRWLPFTLRAGAVRALSAASFLVGTTGGSATARH